MLIGRRREIDEVVARLARRRLVTIIGPAGIGKTTVAVAVAEQVGGDYELGAHVVDLTRIDTPGRDHPELGRHLQASLSTGTYFAYRPEHPVTWRS